MFKNENDCGLRVERARKLFCEVFVFGETITEEEEEEEEDSVNPAS